MSHTGIQLNNICYVMGIFSIIINVILGGKNTIDIMMWGTSVWRVSYLLFHISGVLTTSLMIHGVKKKESKLLIPSMVQMLCFITYLSSGLILLPIYGHGDMNPSTWYPYEDIFLELLHCRLHLK